MHHSRDTAEKQWAETRVLTLAGVARTFTAQRKVLQGFYSKIKMELCHEKTNNVVSEQVRHKHYSHRRWLEAGNFRLRKKNELYYPCSENKGAD